jgi:hypothetical protein
MPALPTRGAKPSTSWLHSNSSPKTSNAESKEQILARNLFQVIKAAFVLAD